MRAECAETKVAADSKLCEGRSMVENAEKKFAEAEAKLHAAESLEAEASRYHRTAERKLHEVEAREDDLRRRISSFKTEYVFLVAASVFVLALSLKLGLYHYPLCTMSISSVII